MGRHYREPIGNTCPQIDEVMKKLDQIKSWCNDIYRYCESAESEMEDLRTANSTLREWGIDEANQVDVMEEQISDLEYQIEELKKELNDKE
jgi:chaperonin cofactor prefoldin